MAIRGLIIAIEKYAAIQGFGSELPGTTAAGVAFRKWLIDTKKAAPENILFCTEDATAEGRTSGAAIDDLLEAIASLPQKGKDRTEQLYVFFSGHGFLFREDERKRAADVLLAADFSSLQSPTAGRKVLRLDEVQLKLQRAMGPRDHFYFIDACRNQLGASQIDVTGTGLNLGLSSLGYPTVYTLYSTNRGAAAFVQSNFSGHLLTGLQGSGRAKVWRPTDEEEMEVNYFSLQEYVKEKLQGQESDTTKEGEGRGVILEIRPAPRYECTVEVAGARPDDEITLTLKNARGQQIGDGRTFKGPKFSFSESPDLYRLSLSCRGRALEPESFKADLYDVCTARFTMPVAEATRRGGPISMSPATRGGPRAEEEAAGPALLQVTGVPSSALSVEDVSSGRQETLSEGVATPLPAGRYVVRMRDSEGVTVRRQEISLEPGKTESVDLSIRPGSPVREAILSYLPGYAYDQRTVSFSERLGPPIADDDLGLWLAIVGASRIVDDPNSFSKLKDLPLASFEDVPPGGSTIYVLAGRDDLKNLRIAVQGPLEENFLEPLDWQDSRQVQPRFAGFRHARIDHRPGPVFLSLAANQEVPLTVSSYCLPNRATLVIAAAEDTGLRIQQYLLPLYHLTGNLDPEVREKLHGNPLEMVRFMALAQRQFARKRDLASGLRYEEWEALLYGKWLDPIMAVLASYELVRRGRLGSMETVIGNLRRFFAGLPDTEALASLSHQSFARPASVPLVLDGLLAVENYAQLLPFPESKLDFTGPWTAWRGAVRR